MRGTGHKLSAIGTSGLIVALSPLLSISPWPAILGVIMGVKAPDYLEIPITASLRLIPHRTVTHWLVLWCGLLGFALIGIYADNGFNSLLNTLLLGYALGGLTHLFCDAGTPMGIPIISPFRRHSFYTFSHPVSQWIFLILFSALGILAFNSRF